MQKKIYRKWNWKRKWNLRKMDEIKAKQLKYRFTWLGSGCCNNVCSKFPIFDIIPIFLISLLIRRSCKIVVYPKNDENM